MGGFVPFRSFSPTRALHSPVFEVIFPHPFEMENNALPKGSGDGCAEGEKLVEPVSCRPVCRLCRRSRIASSPSAPQPPDTLLKA